MNVCTGGCGVKNGTTYSERRSKMRKFMSFWLAAIMLAAAFMVGVAAEDTVAAVEETAGIVDCDTCEEHDHDVTVAPEEVTDDS